MTNNNLTPAELTALADHLYSTDLRDEFDDIDSLHDLLDSFCAPMLAADFPTLRDAIRHAMIAEIDDQLAMRADDDDETADELRRADIALLADAMTAALIADTDYIN